MLLQLFFSYKAHDLLVLIYLDTHCQNSNADELYFLCVILAEDMFVSDAKKIAEPLGNVSLE